MRFEDNILARISASGHFAAMRDLPPARLSEKETLEGVTTTVDGVPVIVTFEKYCYKHYRHTHWAWRIDSARYADE